MGTMAFIGNSTNYLAPFAPYIESLFHAFELMGVHEMPPNFEAGISNGYFLGLILTEDPTWPIITPFFTQNRSKCTKNQSISMKLIKPKLLTVLMNQNHKVNLYY